MTIVATRWTDILEPSARAPPRTHVTAHHGRALDSPPFLLSYPPLRTRVAAHYQCTPLARVLLKKEYQRIVVSPSSHHLLPCLPDTCHASPSLLDLPSGHVYYSVNKLGTSRFVT